MIPQSTAKQSVEQTEEAANRPFPRCLATLPADIDELLADFQKQGQF